MAEFVDRVPTGLSPFVTDHALSRRFFAHLTTTIKTPMRLAMIGTGYVGLVSGACFAEFGTEVTCVDQNADKVARLQRGEIPIYEPGMDALVARGVEAGRLTFTTDLTGAVREADVVFIAVGTPSRRGDGHADLRYVEAAALEIARALQGYTVVVTKSTVPVGTGRRVAEIISEANPEANFDVASNPEFLREGSAIEDFMHPDRIVVGTNSARARDVLTALYRPLALREVPVVVMSLESAELTKYAANAFLATKISFINEIADLCEQVGADVQDIARGMGLDRRIGRTFLHPGPGYGGSCFPKDTAALVRTAQHARVPLRIVESVVQANESRKASMASRIISACGGSGRGKTIGILGVSFKPNTDDMREAPSLSIIPALQDSGAVIQAYDPAAMVEASQMLPGVIWCDSAYQVAHGAHAVVLLTEWNEFRALDLVRIHAVMREKSVLIDLRNVYRPDEVRAVGLIYVAVGRGNSSIV
jgi:UDPglucose 6-dehydrogenase